MKEIPTKQLSIKNSTDTIALYDRLDPAKFNNHDSARNIYRMDCNGNIVWQVKSEFDDNGDAFTNIELDSNSKLVGYRWSGGLYFIDVDNGFASPKVFLK